MTGDDLSSVREIDKLSFSLPWPERAFEYELNNNPDSDLWVAEIANQGYPSTIVGVVVIWFIIDEAHIATLFTHPEFRRSGIARQLVTHALKISASKGMRSVTLEVRSGNLAARSLYEGFGFHIAGKRNRYYKDNNEDAIIMTLYDLPVIERSTDVSPPSDTRQAVS